jgi:D-alanyl-D-alanine dipeptidase
MPSHALPQGFVYINEVDSTIIIDMRYAQKDNFLGRKMTGYHNPKVAILTNEAALALKKAQAIFRKKGYSIVIYDAYRPQRAVNDFMAWANDSSSQEQKALFYPRVDKSKVFELGYVAEKSGHSRGSTVDLSVIDLKKALHPIIPPRKLLDGFALFYLDDGTLDMGTSFDLFDEASHFDNMLVAQEHKERRAWLQKVMQSCGFKPYAEEWWHFTLDNEPFPKTYYDFAVE